DPKNFCALAYSLKGFTSAEKLQTIAIKEPTIICHVLVRPTQVKRTELAESTIIYPSYFRNFENVNDSFTDQSKTYSIGTTYNTFTKPCSLTDLQLMSKRDQTINESMILCHLEAEKRLEIFRENK
ncbi:hypothetical protein C0J52_20848, partial [Blattella germanica]